MYKCMSIYTHTNIYTYIYTYIFIHMSIYCNVRVYTLIHTKQVEQVFSTNYYHTRLAFPAKESCSSIHIRVHLYTPGKSSKKALASVAKTAMSFSQKSPVIAAQEPCNFRKRSPVNSASELYVFRTFAHTHIFIHSRHVKQESPGIRHQKSPVIISSKRALQLPQKSNVFIRTPCIYTYTHVYTRIHHASRAKRR